MAKQRHPSFLLLGDSITQLACDPALSGFHAQLERDYIRRVDIVNRGLSGYNTRWCLELLPDLLRDAYGNREDPLLVTLFLGANDATPATSSQHVPLEAYKQNLHEMVDILRQTLPKAKLLLLTPPAVSSSRECGRTNALAGEYASGCKQVGEEKAIPVVDLWTLMQDDIDSYLCDGLHLSAKGNSAVYTALSHAIAVHFPQLVPEQVPFFYPTWAERAKLDAPAATS